MTMKITKNILLAPIAILFLSSCSEFSSEGNQFMKIRSNAKNFLSCDDGIHEVVINTVDKTSEILFESGLYLKGSYKYDQSRATYFINYFYEDEEVFKYQISTFGGRSIYEYLKYKNMPQLKDKDFKNILNTQFFTKCVLTDVIPR